MYSRWIMKRRAVEDKRFFFPGGPGTGTTMLVWFCSLYWDPLPQAGFYCDCNGKLELEYWVAILQWFHIPIGWNHKISGFKLRIEMSKNPFLPTRRISDCDIMKDQGRISVWKASYLFEARARVGSLLSFIVVVGSVFTVYLRTIRWKTLWSPGCLSLTLLFMNTKCKLFHFKLFPPSPGLTWLSMIIYRYMTGPFVAGPLHAYIL